MKRRYRLLIGLVVLAACTGKKPEQTPTVQPIQVVVTQAQLQASVYYEEYPATVTALDEVQIRAQVSGYISGIYFTDGQKVKKGQKLYSIDAQQYEGAYKQSQANLSVAQANYDKAKQDAERYQNLADEDAIARQTLDHALADMRAAQMQVEAAKANVKTVQTNLQYSTISSPLTGTIGISQVKMGAAVLPGQTLLNTVSTSNPIAVDFNVDEKEIARFTALLNKPASDSVFTLLLPDKSIYKGAGKLVVIDRAVDVQTATIRARLAFENADNVLRVGMGCVVRVLSSNVNPQIVIPHKAVVEQMGEYFAFRVVDGKAALTKIRLGRSVGNNVIVESGINNNDTIITDGVQKLRDGVEVKY